MRAHTIILVEEASIDAVEASSTIKAWLKLRAGALASIKLWELESIYLRVNIGRNKENQFDRSGMPHYGDLKRIRKERSLNSQTVARRATTRSFPRPAMVKTVTQTVWNHFSNLF